MVQNNLNSNIANAGKFYGVNTTNILTNQDGSVGSGGRSYTATEDCLCYIYINFASYNNKIYVDNVEIINGNYPTFLVLLKKGQTVLAKHADSGSQIIKIKAYSLKG